MNSLPLPPNILLDINYILLVAICALIISIIESWYINRQKSLRRARLERLTDRLIFLINDVKEQRLLEQQQEKDGQSAGASP